MRILVGVDGSPYSDAALDEVSRRTWPKGSEILVVHAFEFPLAATPEVWAPPPDYSERLDHICREQADAIVNAAIKDHHGKSPNPWRRLWRCGCR